MGVKAGCCVEITLEETDVGLIDCSFSYNSASNHVVRQSEQKKPNKIEILS